MSNTFCRSINIILFNKPLSNPFKTSSAKTNIDLLNDCLENLIDSYIIYLHPIERHLFGHELPFQWSSKLMETMRLTWSWKHQFSSRFYKWDSVLELCKYLGRLLERLRGCRVQKSAFLICWYHPFKTLQKVCLPEQL